MLLSWLWLLPGRVCIQENLGGKTSGGSLQEAGGSEPRGFLDLKGSDGEGRGIAAEALAFGVGQQHCKFTSEGRSMMVQAGNCR